MDAVVHFLQPLDLHPVVDHFTVALLIVGVLVDLVASLFPTRSWMRYMALTLMILGAIAAGCSYFSGDMEADRVWNALGEPAKQVLHRHAMLAQYGAIAFGVLALWRILVEVGALAGTRSIYLIVAVIAVCLLGYIGHLGGVLVYTYGTGTALMAAEQSPTPTETPTPSTSQPLALPTVSVPTPQATPTAPAAASSATPSPTPTGAPTGV
ncbi:MAG TPA: DUF2231 domain-containing protein [Candidatus Binataceae bacterium]|nr:DUF2231 domain-containing protein [Candidatus Binataceae bacterium]